MASMPYVHVCSQLTVENDKMRKILKKLKHQNAALEKELLEINDKLKLQRILKECVTSRNVEVQTEPSYVYKANLRLIKPPKKKDDGATRKEETAETQASKLLIMYNSLMRRYEKELKNNTNHIETIAILNLRINELEQQVKQSNQQIRELESKTWNKKSCSKRKATLASADHALDIRVEIENLRKDRKRLTNDKKRLKNELKGLDKDFFEELEDLKYALQQSAKLNREYEKTLTKVCTQHGITYPMPQYSTPSPIKRL